MGVVSDYKEKGTVGFSEGDFLWDEDGNHYLVVALNSVLGMNIHTALLHRYRVNTTKFGKFYITKDKQRVYLTKIVTASEMDLMQEESLWNS